MFNFFKKLFNRSEKNATVETVNAPIITPFVEQMVEKDPLAKAEKKVRKSKTKTTTVKKPRKSSKPTILSKKS
jgi:hypothetical protein